MAALPQYVITLRVALSCPGVCPVAAFSMANVLAELRWTGGTPTAAPSGFAAGLGFVDFHDLQVALTRAFALSKALPDELLHTWQETLIKLGPTEREATVKQRIGQELFREGLLALGRVAARSPGSRCPSCCARVTPNLGSMLPTKSGSTLTTAFCSPRISTQPSTPDRIAVEDNGQVITSPALDALARALLGLNSASRVNRLTDRHMRYLCGTGSTYFGETRC